MTEDDIRKNWTSPSWGDKRVDDQVLQYTIRDILVEIAAQLAKLNAKTP